MSETEGYIDSEGDYVPGPDDFEGEDDTFTLLVEGIETEKLAVILGKLLIAIVKAHRSEATIVVSTWGAEEDLLVWPEKKSRE